MVYLNVTLAALQKQGHCQLLDNFRVRLQAITKDRSPIVEHVLHARSQVCSEVMVLGLPFRERSSGKSGSRSGRNRGRSRGNRSNRSRGNRSSALLHGYLVLCVGLTADSQGGAGGVLPVQ
jgi:hypothetical protein